MTSLNWSKISSDVFARKMEVLENMTRNRMQYGGPLSAEEIVTGVRLSHEDFLRLFDLARPSLWQHQRS